MNNLARIRLLKIPPITMFYASDEYVIQQSV